jgi:Uma2 family endonuclease
MTVANPVHRLTEAEYHEIERRAEFRSEFLDGEMFAMAGGTRRHSLIKCNLIRALGNELKGQPCRLYDSELQSRWLRCIPKFDLGRIHGLNLNFDP